MTTSKVSFAAARRSSSSNTSAFTNTDRHAIGRCRLFRQRQRRRRLIERDRLPSRRPFAATMREAAGVAIGVEHVLAFRERGHEGAVVALVVIPAGLLAAGEIGEIAHAVFLDRDAPSLALCRAHIVARALRARAPACRCAGSRSLARAVLSSASSSGSISASMPAVVICTTTVSPKRSMVRPGRPSPSAWIEPIERPRIDRVAQRQRALARRARRSRCRSSRSRRLSSTRMAIRLFGIEIAGADAAGRRRPRH